MTQPADDLWNDMIAEGHSAFTLAVATQGAAMPRDDRERSLVNVAVAAGVAGALAAFRRGLPTEGGGGAVPD